ncbi:TIM-barrel domain-containing protein [Gallaecimonas sp. GXIMD4217]|uniref:glycoside hydrolase family 31 protein n=1 Tax=Gallaecimonas sp. GXIMD4217 TaxID=3131927 RepID=UPI00311AF204
MKMLLRTLLLLPLLALLLSCALNGPAYHLDGHTLVLERPDGQLRLSARSADALELEFLPQGQANPASLALVAPKRALPARLSDQGDHLSFAVDGIRAEIDKDSLAIRYYRGERLLLAEAGGFAGKDRGVELGFRLQDGEQLMGGGQRVLGMDRRGHKLPLYNKAHYGYSTRSSQMYFGLPMVLSSNKYLLLFDNTAKGELDLGHDRQDELRFSAVGGRRAYVVVAGGSFGELTQHHSELTGRQPLPPRWALGSFASRFGYHSEAEAREVVARYRDANMPLDAIVLDLFWFGPDIKGHMGNLAWDRDAFPEPEKMLADFKAQGVKTVLITEPFVLTSSQRWDEAVAAGAITPNGQGQPGTFDFYFGNTGLVDVFDARGRDWFWQHYQRLLDQGVAGFWGDLGEPEVHPAELVHAAGPADEVHNGYGHRWAQMVFERHREAAPEQRPFILMRAGFAGSQRFGMMPWTGDVSRSWGGLKPQVELGLQMSALGLGYIHSDLGGFAGGEAFDAELYLRWLQLGVFQPLFRPHGQEQIPSEPVFHDQAVQDRARSLLELRYRLLPYNYSLAYENSLTGRPLMRSLLQATDDVAWFDEKDSFLWGDAFLVTPVTEPGAKTVSTRLPGGVWFDLESGQRFDGALATRATSLDRLPVLVRAGAFVAMAEPVTSTDHYRSDVLELHYWADQSVLEASGQLYEDDGRRFHAPEQAFERLDFAASQSAKALGIRLSRGGPGYAGMPKERRIRLVVHHLARPERVLLDGSAVPFSHDGQTLTLEFDWDHQPLNLQLELPHE